MTKITVRIFRFDPSVDEASRWQVYEVPRQPNMSVFSLLRYVYEELDPTLAFRDYRCGRGICANCRVKLDGKPVKACSTLIDDREIAVISILSLIALLQLSGLLLVKLGMRPFYIQSDGEGIKLVRGPVDPQSFPALEPGTAPMKTEQTVPVIIDTDMAGDDWMAILFLLQHPNVNVVAITVTGTGEAHCSPGIRHALDLLLLAGRPEVPVTCGRESPLMGTHAFPMAWRNRVGLL